MPIDWSLLSAPFPAEDVEWKPGATTRDKKKGLAMAYITARAVQERLDEVFTPGGWRNEFREGPGGGVICRISFRNDDGEWVWREDGADNTDVEAVKGGLSNATKRAGAALGIGRYLYKLPQQWVRLDERGRFAERPRIPREYLPQGSPSQGSPSQGPPPQRAPQSSRPSGDARPQGGRPQADPRPQGIRPQPGQTRVIRREGGRPVSGDGANRPAAPPRG